MKLGRAIEINESLLDGTYDHRDKQMEDALELGIEALKRIKAIRPYSNSDKSYYLKGETKD